MLKMLKDPNSLAVQLIARGVTIAACWGVAWSVGRLVGSPVVFYGVAGVLTVLGVWGIIREIWFKIPPVL
jgi:hypothetical protein